MTSDGGWIGLNDQSEEHRHIWNYNKYSQPEFVAWGSSQPDNYNGMCNVQNCVRMKGWNKKWDDVACDREFDFVCERKGTSFHSIIVLVSQSTKNSNRIR